MTEILNQPAVQIAALVLGGLFLLDQTRKQGLILSLVCLLVCLGVVMVVVDVMAQDPLVGAVISKRIIVINETEFIESEPIIETVTEHFVIVTPNEDPAPAQVQVSADWGNVAPAVARWQPNINQAIAHCGLETPGYDAALLMAAIVTQESSGDPNAIGAANDTGLGQVVSNSHPLFPNRPSHQQLLDPQFNLNFAACLLRDNLKRTGGVEAAVNAYNGNGVHNGRTYAQIIFSHYNGFQPVVSSPQEASQSTNFGSFPVSGTPRITQKFHGAHPGLDIVRRVTACIHAREIANGLLLTVATNLLTYLGGHGWKFPVLPRNYGLSAKRKLMLIHKSTIFKTTQPSSPGILASFCFGDSLCFGLHLYADLFDLITPKISFATGAHFLICYAHQR